MTVQEDVTELQHRIQLPIPVKAARWGLMPVVRGASGAPGPTDTALYAYLSVEADAWSRLKALPAASKPIPLAADVASALLPAAALASLPRDGAGRYLLSGALYDAAPFGLGSYRGLYALRAGDGLLVVLQTM